MNNDPYAGIRTRLANFGVTTNPEADVEAARLLERAVEPVDLGQIDVVAQWDVATNTTTFFDTNGTPMAPVVRSGSDHVTWAPVDEINSPAVQFQNPTTGQEEVYDPATGRRHLFSPEGSRFATRYLGRPVGRFIATGRRNGRNTALNNMLGRPGYRVPGQIQEEIRQERTARDARDRERQRREEENRRRRLAEEEAREVERRRIASLNTTRIPGPEVPAVEAVAVLRQLVEDMVHDWTALNEIYSNTARNRGWCSDYEDRCESYNEQFRVLHLVGRPENWHGHNSCWRTVTGDDYRGHGED